MDKLKIAYKRYKIRQDARKQAKAIAALRAELAAWGVDTRHLTDEQLVQHVRQVGKAWAAAGVTMEQAAKNMQAAFANLPKLADIKIPPLDVKVPKL